VKRPQGLGEVTTDSVTTPFVRNACCHLFTSGLYGNTALQWLVTTMANNSSTNVQRAETICLTAANESNSANVVMTSVSFNLSPPPQRSFG